MIKNIFKLIVITTVIFFLSSCNKNNDKVAQITISKIATMPNMPEPYKMIDWKQKAKNFDNVVFDFDAEGDFLPFIWIDDARRNIDQQTFGIYTAIGDSRQGKNNNNGEFHESLAALGALLSAGLVDIDKENQDGYNYVKMVQNYFNSDNGWNIVMNNTNPEVAALGGGYGRDWWYDVFPNVLYYAVSDIFPEVDNSEHILRSIAEQFYKADSILDGNYNYSYFDYAAMKGINNHIPQQQDAAAGHAYVLYSAYNRFGDERYLRGAMSAIEALLSQTESRYYEVLMPFGAYTAARLNAEQGTNYDISKIINWTFDGCKADDGRKEWGVISDRWGNYDVHGLQGSMKDGDAFGFLMNTFCLAWPTIPMVRYNPKYAKAMGKWMLNAANAARLCYPYHIADELQWLPNKKSITRNVIAYEGLKREDSFYKKKELIGISPVAIGDGPRWTDTQPEESMFSIYGSGYAGIFGSIIEKSNVAGILKLNCNATDFYSEKAYPTYLYYNPYNEKKTVRYNASKNNVDLYDIITKSIIATNINKDTEFDINPDDVRLLVEIPTGVTLHHQNNKIIAEGRVVCY